MNKSIKREIMNFFSRFVMIYGFTMLATLFFLVLFSQDASLNYIYFIDILFFSLVANLPPFVFYSRHELNDQELIFRQILCLILEIALLLPLGNIFGMWSGLVGGLLFCAITIAISLLVRLLLYGKDYIEANEINDYLQKINQE